MVNPSADEEPEHSPLTTKDGWLRFVDDAPACPRLLPARERKRLTEQERQIDDEVRMDYHARLVVVATPTVRQVFTTGRRLVLLNRHQISGRRGLIVTGQAGTGKTTAITQLGRNHELLVRQRLGAAAYAGRLRIAKVDGDANPDLVQKYNVRAFPTLLFVKQGQIRDQVVGNVPRTTLEKRLENLL